MTIVTFTVMLTGLFALIGEAEGDEYCIYCDSALSSAILFCLYACPNRDDLESLPYVLLCNEKLTLFPALPHRTHARGSTPILPLRNSCVHRFQCHE
jgi:hypothetical protein